MNDPIEIDLKKVIYLSVILKESEIKNIFLDGSLIQYKSQREDYFICKICFGIARDPQMCIKCENLYCLSCRISHAEKSNECSVCKESPFKCMQIPRFIKDVFEKICIKCPFNCGQIIIYKDLISNHMIVCPNYLKKYKCENCDMIFEAKFEEDPIILEHYENCPFFEQSCKYCKNLILKKDMNDHLNNCNKKILNCEECFYGCPIEYITAHDNYFCKIISNLQKISNLIKNFEKDLIKNK